MTHHDASPATASHQSPPFQRGEEQPQPAPIEYLTAAETAVLLRISQVTLSRWRIEGHGPAFCKLGRRVVYARSDLTAWTAKQRRRSTSDTELGDPL